LNHFLVPGLRERSASDALDASIVRLVIEQDDIDDITGIAAFFSKVQLFQALINQVRGD
jgi:hypothetical protein